MIGPASLRPVLITKSRAWLTGFCGFGTISRTLADAAEPDHAGQEADDDRHHLGQDVVDLVHDAADVPRTMSATESRIVSTNLAIRLALFTKNITTS